MPMTLSTPKSVFILSDGTGETAETVLNATLRQFQTHPVNTFTFAHIDTEEKIEHAMRRAQKDEALVISTLVQKNRRQFALNLSQTLNVSHIDLMGQMLAGVEAFLQHRPVEVPGIFHQADERYFRRVAAVEFTVKADDGKEPRMLEEADLILVGVSRTSKTPLSTFLAHKGYKVANVPLVLDRPQPEALFTIDPNRIFALTIGPDALQHIRHSRLKSMRMSSKINYGDLDYILAELEYANELFAANPEWPIIDVTERAIEETASRILNIFHERFTGRTLRDPSQLS